VQDVFGSQDLLENMFSKYYKFNVSEEHEIGLLKRQVHSRVHCSTIYTSQQMETTSNGRMDKGMWVIYALKYYSAIKQNDVWSFAATWMNLEKIMLSEIS
jgi:hypothetical protein